jgi:hypothetical protein
MSRTDIATLSNAFHFKFCTSRKSRHRTLVEGTL